MPAYMKIGDIKGESSEAHGGLHDHVLISSYQTGGGEAQLGEGISGPGSLTITRPLNGKASPFRQMATSGKRLDEVTLVDDAGDKGDAKVFKLIGVKVADAATKSAPMPTEQITLNYEKIEWSRAPVTRWEFINAWPVRSSSVFENVTYKY